MGYKPYKSQSNFVLKDTSKLIVIITDIIVLHQDLTVIQEVVESVCNSIGPETVSGRQILLNHVLIARQKSLPDKNACIHFLMQNLSQLSSLELPATPLSQDTPRNMSMLRDVVVVSDGQLSSNIRPRKNDPQYISRDGGSGSYSPNPSLSSSDSRQLPTSPPPDASQLPPPALTQSQVWQLVQGTTPARDLEEPVNFKRDDSDTSLTASQRQGAFHRQIYHQFPSTYKSTLFNIGNEGEEEEIQSPDHVPSLRNTGAPAKRLHKGSSLDIDRDTDQLTRRPLRHNSSAGNILDAALEPQYQQVYQQHPQRNTFNPPPTSQGPPQYNQYTYGYQQHQGDYYHQPQRSPFQNSNFFPRGGVDMSRRSSDSNFLAGNAPLGHAHSNNYINAKDLNQYNADTMDYANNTTSHTWSSGRPSQQELERYSNKQMTSTGAAAVSRPLPALNGWTCRHCRIWNATDFPECTECHRLADWVDTTPYSPSDVNRVPSKKNIQTDYSHPKATVPWECPYCMSKNKPIGNVCEDCKAEVSSCN